MRKIFTNLFFLVFGIQMLCSQPYNIKDILNRLPDRQLPFVGLWENKKDSGSSGVQNDDKKIIDHLYLNVQLTEWSNACDYMAESPRSCYHFILPGTQNYSLLMIRFGGVTDWKTDVLLSVTIEGKILDQMPVAVWASITGVKGWSPVMQYEITSDGKIIVYRLVPTSDKSIPLLEITSFTANRVDKTYTVDSEGKFRLVNTKTYEMRTYTREMLESPSYNIWSGGENPVASGCCP